MEKSNSPKTTVFNLIILDESGSMSMLKPQTVSGCNELLNVIRSSQEKNAETQRNLVSIFAFQSDGDRPSRYIIKNSPIQQTKDVSPEDYQPWGCTPLYDAIGSTLSDLRTVASTHEDAMAIVTIITDGLENSSKNYDRSKVLHLINACKELGWTINFIGGGIDERASSRDLAIDNSLHFECTAEGTNDMWSVLSNSIEKALHEDADEADMCVSERIKSRKFRSKRFFR